MLKALLRAAMDKLSADAKTTPDPQASQAQPAKAGVAEGPRQGEGDRQAMAPEAGARPRT
ncbi:MAG TPA: hypothetical protein VIN35_11800 [Hydrogenophaga sp.]